MPDPAPILPAVLAHPDDETIRCGGTLALLFISGLFVPLARMAPWAEAPTYLSPLTDAQDGAPLRVTGFSL